jgi:hypothetical protein
VTTRNVAPDIAKYLTARGQPAICPRAEKKIGIRKKKFERDERPIPRRIAGSIFFHPGASSSATYSRSSHIATRM